MMTNDNRIRVAQMVGWLNRGGAETWLMQVLKHIDRSRFEMDFIVHGTVPGAYDEDVKSLGGRLVICCNPATELAAALRENGPYDIAHCHLHHFSGLALRAARGVGIPVRIAHSHSDSSATDSRASFRRKLYIKLMDKWIRRDATLGLAVSRGAARALFGDKWTADPRWSVLNLGIDTTPFRATPDKEQVRASLGIPPDSFVIGHAGRLSVEKNHTFLIDVVAEVTKKAPSVRALFVGGGPLRQDLENKVGQMGLAEHVIFAGERHDVPELMLGAMDAFVFPSIWEGVPMALIEAQAAGLPCLISDVISDEADIIKPLITRLSIKEPAAFWAERVLRLMETGHIVELEKPAPDLVDEGGFSIRSSAERLQRIYEQTCANRQKPEETAQNLVKNK